MDSIHTEKLLSLRADCQDVLQVLCDRFANDTESASELHRLVASKDLQADFASLLVTAPQSAGFILRAAIAALANIQSLFAIDAELSR